MIARVVGCLALLALLGGCTPAPQPEAALEIFDEGTVQTNVIDVDGVPRTYLIHEPVDTTPGALVPLLIVLHGAGGDGARAERTTGITADANDDGFLVAYPNGTAANTVEGELSWNAGACCGQAKVANVDDVGFLMAMIAELEASYSVDPSRVFLVGFSNGGMLSYRLACEHADAFAGIAVVAGALNFSPCKPPSPVSVLIVHGTADATVPYRGGPTNDRTAARFGQWTNTSVEFATDFWTGTDKCEADPLSTTEEPLAVDSYLDCTLGSRVEVATIAGGTHSWPRLESAGVDASELILEFFGLN
jgi:polyhydroxybutyrate depolymerase